MRVDLSGLTGKRIEEVVALDLTSQMDAVLLAQKALGDEIMEKGNASLEIDNIKDDLELIRLSLKSAGDRSRALRKRI